MPIRDLGSQQSSRMMEQGLLADPTDPPVVRPGSLSEHFFRPDDDSDSSAAHLNLPGAEKAEPAEAKSSVFGSVMNLSNTILSAGALAMPVACAQTGIALFVVLLLTVAMGAHSALRMLALCVDKHAMDDGRYASLGARAFGAAGSTFATLAVALQQTGPCVIYIQIVADILVPILCEANRNFVSQPTVRSCNEDSLLRVQLQLFVIICFMLPLSMIKSMDTLKFGSTLSMIFMSAFAVLVVVRGIWVIQQPDVRIADFEVRCPPDALTGSDTNDDSGGEPHTRLTGADPSAQTDCDLDLLGDDIEWIYAKDGNLLKAIPILCFAFLCHPNMFPIYQKLNSASHKKMATVSRCSILLSISVYLVVGIFGYVTFLRRATTEADLLVSSPEMLLFD